jgi:hypothetical protein
MIRKLLFVLAFALLPLGSWAQSTLPPCTRVSSGTECFGRIDYSDGKVYVGDLKGGSRHGQGVLYNVDGSANQWGTWEDGKLLTLGGIEIHRFALPCPLSGYKHNCHGTTTNYVGGFRDDKRHGRGTHTLPDGSQYVGDYRYDKRDGIGIEYRANGSVNRSGRWEHDNLVQSLALNTNHFPFNPTQVAVTPPVDPSKAERDRLAGEVEAERKKRQDLEQKLADAEAKERERQQAQVPQPQRPQVALRNERRLALVIGNSSYKVSPLDNPANDANDVAESLKKFGFQTSL